MLQTTYDEPLADKSLNQAMAGIRTITPTAANAVAGRVICIEHSIIVNAMPSYFTSVILGAQK